MTASLSISLEDKVLNAKSGDTQAFAELVALTQNLTTTLALSIVKDLDSSEDVAQQVYIKLWQQLPSLKKEQSFLPWLRQITRYTAINYLRDAKVVSRVDSPISEGILENLTDNSETPSTKLSQAQINQHLSDFIDALPDESRELILLYYREGESTRQVANLLELSEANVRKKLSRARQTIKQQWLQKHGKLVLATAPGIGFTTLIANLVSTSSPAAAATVTTSVSATKTGIWSKLVIGLGGSLIGAGMGMLAVLFSTKMLIDNLQDRSYIDDIKRNRNRMMGWILFCSLLLTFSYEMTTGWWAPVMSYILFALGLVRMIELTQLLAVQAGYRKTMRFCLDPSQRTWKVMVMNWAGPIMGGVGLLAGLYRAGRF